MRVFLNLILSLLCIPLLSSDNNLIRQADVSLPKEIFLKIMENVVPNLLLPTHPEEIIELDRKTAPYKIVCKTWKNWLDQNVNFRDMENLFVGNYFWPPHEFVRLYSARFRQTWYHPDQALQDEEQRLVACYQNACDAIDIIKLNNSPCNANNSCALLMQNNFYTPFYGLLRCGQLSLWYNLLTDALEYHGLEYHKKISAVFAQQYLKYCQTNNKIMLIEKTCTPHFSNDVMEIAKKSLNKASKKTPFDYFNYSGALLLRSTSDGFCMLYEYIQQGGFLTPEMYDAVQRLFLSQEETIKKLRTKHYEIVEEIKKACDLNVLLPYILVNYVKDSQPGYLFIEQKTVVKINYLRLLNNFYRLYLRHKKSYCYVSERLVAFFEKYQCYFIQKDEKARSFVYCLLLATFDKPTAMKLLSSFIQGVGQSHEIFSEDERVVHSVLFKENFFYYIDHLSKTERSLLMTYFNIKKSETLSSYGSIQSNEIIRKYDEPIIQSDYLAKINGACFFKVGLCCFFSWGIAFGSAYLINALSGAGHPFAGNRTHI